MQKNRIFYKFFKLEKEAFCIRMLFKSGFKKFLDIAQQMHQTFLLGGSSDLIPISVVKVTDQNAVVKCSQVIDGDLGTPAFVDIEESNKRIGEAPEPVAFPTGFIGMHEWVVRQGLLKSIVKWLALPGHVLVKADQSGVRKFQVAKTFQRASGVVVGAFNLVAHKRGLGANIRTDESVGDFVLAPAVNNPLAVGTPVITVCKARGDEFPVFKILLDVFGGMIAGRNSFAAADRTTVEIDILGFVDHFRIGTKMSLVSDGSSAFGCAFRRVSLFIFGKGILQGIGQFFFELRVVIFKFLDAFLKLFDLMIGKIHGEFKRINPVAKILAFRQNAFRILAVKKNAEFAKGAIWAFYSVSVRILRLRPTHAASPMVNRFSECFLYTL